MLYSLIFKPTDRTVADKIVLCKSLWCQGVGLIGHKELDEGEGLWLPGVGSVHTFGVRFPLDILFLNRHFQMTAAHIGVRPAMIVTAPGSTSHCIELKSGTLSHEEALAFNALWSIES